MYSDLNHNKRLLAQTPATTLQAGSSYLLVAESDNRPTSGYKIGLLRWGFILGDDLICQAILRRKLT